MDEDRPLQGVPPPPAMVRGKAPLPPQGRPDRQAQRRHHGGHPLRLHHAPLCPLGAVEHANWKQSAVCPDSGQAQMAKQTLKPKRSPPLEIVERVVRNLPITKPERSE